MSTPPTHNDVGDLPPHPLLRIEITADGRVLVDGWQIEVPGGDVRAAAVNAAESYATNRGHPVRVTVRLPDGQAVNLLAAPGQRVTPQVQSAQTHAPRQLPAGPTPPPAAVARQQPTPWTPHDSPARPDRLVPVADQGRHYPVTQVPTVRVALPQAVTADATGQIPRRPALPVPSTANREDALCGAYALLKDHPQPPADVVPEDVPAWPSLAITLHEDGRADVENHPAPIVPGFTAREAAIAAAALHVRALGLGRPVRALATEPDGTAWPVIIHPNGSATGAGDPIRPAKKRRWRRRHAG